MLLCETYLGDFTCFALAFLELVQESSENDADVILEPEHDELNDKRSADDNPAESTVSYRTHADLDVTTRAFHVLFRHLELAC